MASTSSNSFLDTVQSPNYQETRIVGSFHPSGSGGVSGSTGQDYNVVRVGTGTYDVHLSGAFGGHLAHFGHLQVSSGSHEPSAFKLNSIYHEPSDKLILTVMSGASGGSDSAADLDPDDNSKINFEVVFKRTDV